MDNQFDIRTLLLAILAFILTIYLTYIASFLYLRHRSPFNNFVFITFIFGIIATVSKLYYETAPTIFTSAIHLGEVSIAIAAAMHESLVVYRFAILNVHRKRIPMFLRVFLWMLLWILCIYRIVVEFLPESMMTVNLLAKYLFYGTVVGLDIIISCLSLWIIFEIKKTLLLGLPLKKQQQQQQQQNIEETRRSNYHTKGLNLIRYVILMIAGEICAAFAGLILNMTIGTHREQFRLAKQSSDIFIYIAAYFALNYSSNLMRLISLKPNNKVQESQQRSQNVNKDV